MTKPERSEQVPPWRVVLWQLPKEGSIHRGMRLEKGENVNLTEVCRIPNEVSGRIVDPNNSKLTQYRPGRHSTDHFGVQRHWHPSLTQDQCGDTISRTRWRNEGASHNLSSSNC
jgi:hypothetical protein